LLCSIILCFSVVSSTKTCSADVVGTVYIRADGSIDPPTALISTLDNITYTLTGDIFSGLIVIERDNIVVDGAGYTLQGAYASGSRGIDVTGRSNITIENTNIKGYVYGIYLDSSSDNAIYGNSLTSNYGNGYSISVTASSGNSISGNTITTNNGGGIEFHNSTGNNISGNNIADNFDNGIELHYSSSNSITLNNLTDNAIGIHLENSSNNIVSWNILANNYHGISLDSSSNNTICRNTMIGHGKLSQSGAGILIISSSGNVISGNNMTGNSEGIYFFYVSNNIIIGNDVRNNFYGIWGLDSSSNNSIFHNNFANNNIQHGSTTGNSTNVWDNGLEGNYWSDYNGTDSNQDGIGDTPYVIDENNTDHYPLMGTFYGPWTYRNSQVDVISNSTVSNFWFTLDALWGDGTVLSDVSFDVTGDTGTTGFCRVHIPFDLFNGTYRVLVNGTEVPYTLLQCSNITDSYLYFTYAHSTKKVMVLPEFPPFLVLPLFMIATLLAIVIYKRRILTRAL
jgi:parallel beta-helix repeat protein